MSSRYSSVLMIAFATMALCLCGCQHDASEIGTNHVAVLSVTRWDDYKSSLQPNFALSENDALAQAVPDTLQLQQSLTESFGAGLAVKLAPSTTLPAGYGTNGSGNGLSAPALVAPPATSQPSLGGVAALNSDPYLRYLAATALFQEVKLIDRYVRDAAIPNGYRAYIVRFQVCSMPTQRHEAYDSYVDLSMFLDRFEQPLASGTGPMDFGRLNALFNHLNVMVSPTVPSTAVIPSPDEAAEIDRVKQRKTKFGEMRKLYGDALAVQNAEIVVDIVRALESLRSDVSGLSLKTGVGEDSRAALITAIDNLRNDILAGLTPPHDKTPIIIPLLVTDEIESAMASRNAADLQQLALSLSAAYASIGASANASDSQQAIRNAVGRDYNSLLSVARVNDNTVHIRIGARQTGATTGGAHDASHQSENYEITPENHLISLLVMIPKADVESEDEGKTQDHRVYFGTHTSFRRIVDVDDWMTPTIVTDNEDEGINDKIDTVAAAFHNDYLSLTNPDPTKPAATNDKSDERSILYKAALAAQNSDYAAFVKALAAPEGKTLNVGAMNRLWMRMTEMRIDSTYDSGSFPLPEYSKVPTVDKDQQTLILTDDGKQMTTHIAGDFSKIDPQIVTATLGFGKIPNSTPPEYQYKIVAGAFDLSNGLTITFPSWDAINLNPKTKDSGADGTTPPKGTLMADWKVNLKIGDQPAQPFTNPIYVAPPPAGPSPLVATLSINRAKLAPDLNRQDSPTVTVTLGSELKSANESLKDNAKPVFPALTIDGCGVASLDNLKPNSDGSWPISASTQQCHFQLTGLSPGTNVVFALKPPNKAYSAPSAQSLVVDNLPPAAGK